MNLEVVIQKGLQPGIVRYDAGTRNHPASSRPEKRPVPQAASENETGRAQHNVVTFAAPADTFMTAFMFDQATQAAQLLPAGWFTVSLVRDMSEGVRQDHVMIIRVAGPPVGSFQLWRGSRGRFRVLHEDEADNVAESGPYRTIEAAVEAIRADIGLQLAAWGVMPVPCAA